MHGQQLEVNVLIFYPGPFGMISSVFLHGEQMFAAGGKAQEERIPQSHLCLIRLAVIEGARQLI